MTKEQINSSELSENELLQSIVENGQIVAGQLQRKFGEVFYPMKFVELPTCRLAYANPGGDYPMSLRMHQIIDGQAAGVEVSLFFKPIPGTGGEDLRLFEDEQNRSNISDSTGGRHTYYFIQQNVDGSLATVPGPNSPEVDIDRLQSYCDFVSELAESLEVGLQADRSH